MAYGLESLVSYLPKDSFKNLCGYYGSEELKSINSEGHFPKELFHSLYGGEKLKLLLRKGVFPHDWFDGYDKLVVTYLPSIEEFHSKLYYPNISKEDYKRAIEDYRNGDEEYKSKNKEYKGLIEDYEHAKEVWETFEMKTFSEYHNLYLETDVLLLADVFENFRDLCQKEYKLDPAWYYTAPGLSWDALLKYTKIELELLKDQNMLLFFEEGLRGGVSTISNRYAKANNKYMIVYNEKEEIKYIIYLDANNLYGWAMSRPLPVGWFKWMTKGQLSPCT